MNAVVDTSSWRFLVKAYLPFDNNAQTLQKFLSSEMTNGRLVILNRVIDELKLWDKSKKKGDQYFFMKQEAVNNTDEAERYAAQRRLNNMLNDQFRTPRDDYIRAFILRMGSGTQVDNSSREKLKALALRNYEESYEDERSEYIQSADWALIMYAYNEKVQGHENVTVVTEETPYSSDNKLLKKNTSYL